jgi:hypothetical protein
MKIADELIPMFLIDVMEDGEAAPAAPGGATISQNNLGQVLPTYFPKFIKKRKKLIEPYKDFRKSKDAEKGWRSARYNHLRGIRKFAKSVEGKKFHRNLANFLTNREPGHTLNRYESAELAALLSSFRTHALLELAYYKPFTEEVEFFNAIEALIKMVDGYSTEILEAVYYYNDYEIKEDFYDNLVRILEPAGVIHSLALKSGKTEAEVEDLWNQAKGIVKKEYNKDEDDENYWALVTGTLKKSLGIKDEEKKVNE